MLLSFAYVYSFLYFTTDLLFKLHIVLDAVYSGDIDGVVHAVGGAGGEQGTGMGFAEGERTSSGQSVPGLDGRPAAVAVDADDLDGGCNPVSIVVAIDNKRTGCCRA